MSENIQFRAETLSNHGNYSQSGSGTKIPEHSAELNISARILKHTAKNTRLKLYI